MALGALLLAGRSIAALDPGVRGPLRLALGALLLAGCGGAALDPGVEAWLRVGGAQYVRGAPPTPGAGPSVLALNVSRSTASPGDADLNVTGTLEPAGNAVGLWLEGDRGWWLLPAGLPEVTSPQAPTFAITAALARDVPQGPQVLKAVALSSDGTAGAPRAWPLEVRARNEPSGALIVSLRWDTDADLDLHVVDAAGVEIWARNPNSWQAVPGVPMDPNAWKQGGLLDVDSNAQCAIDGRNTERVVWGAAAPPGRYQVRVDAFSMCGQRAARWTIEVLAQGQRVALTAGVATAESTRPPHDLGAGVLALEFELP